MLCRTRIQCVEGGWAYRREISACVLPAHNTAEGNRAAAQHSFLSFHSTSDTGTPMTRPAIITVAITGAIPRKADTPAVPVTPSEQIESTHQAFEAGAAAAHIHVRNRAETPSSHPQLLSP